MSAYTTRVAESGGLVWPFSLTGLHSSHHLIQSYGRKRALKESTEKDSGLKDCTLNTSKSLRTIGAEEKAQNEEQGSWLGREQSATRGKDPERTVFVPFAALLKD